MSRSRNSETKKASKSRGSAKVSPRIRASSSTRGKSSAGSAKSRKVSRSGQVTTDHEEIQRWVEERKGSPATVRGTGRDSQEAGLLRIDFPGYSGQDSLEHIDWDEFFEKFEESKLAFLYDPDKKSRFNKMIARGTARTRSSGRSSK
ncbi:MAG: hypothetical protein ACTHMT_03920 [Verrucomicrobiota bacterium]